VRKWYREYMRYSKKEIQIFSINLLVFSLCFTIGIVTVNHERKASLENEATITSYSLINYLKNSIDGYLQKAETMAFLVEEFKGISPSLETIGNRLLNYDAILALFVRDNEGNLISYPSDIFCDQGIGGQKFCSCIQKKIETMEGSSSVITFGDNAIGIIGRHPILLQGGDRWGDAFIVLKLSSLLMDSDFEHFVARGFDYRFTVNLEGNEYPLLVSSSTDGTLKNGLSMGFDLMSYHWNIELRPKSGWYAKRTLFFQSLFSFLVSIFYSLLITEAIHLKTQRRILKTVATTDFLTGVGNRRNLEELMAKRIGRRKAPFVYCFLDMDNFKQVNDQYGHLAGDVILQQTVERILGCLASGDFLARVGGDEFVAILEKTDTYRETVENILVQTKASYIVEGVVISSSLSIGYALYAEDSSSFSLLAKIADERMYRMKREHKEEVQGN
jgi:diguanylate cyclase (GGDEF)-like protein